MKKIINRLGNIALTLSGGGYRAAAFHLGTLQYLDRIGLLEDVKTLSTVSGGTITGVKYALSKIDKISFKNYFVSMYNFMKNNNIIKQGLKRIGAECGRTTLGYYDLITAAAEVYDEAFLNEMRPYYDKNRHDFGIFWKNKIHLEEIIFNASEFRTGLGFRFQKSKSKTYYIGNKENSIPHDTAKSIRLADIIAASSCFPGGFEPISFPYDFKWPDDKVPQDLRKKFQNPLPLMDGGVFDNQGIHGAVIADERRKFFTDLFIISDTDRRNNSIYEFPKTKEWYRLKLKHVNLISLAFVIFSVFTTLSVFYTFSITADTAFFRFIALYASAMLLSISVAASILIIRKKIIKKFHEILKEFKINLWQDIKNLTLDEFIDMVELRVTSIFALTSEIFMKRVRGLIYYIFYKNERYQGKRISNLIYDLDKDKKEYKPEFLKPNMLIRNVIRKSNSMKTTLWFNNEDELKNLIAGGQITFCFNLIEYIYRKRSAIYRVPKISSRFSKLASIMNSNANFLLT